MGWEEQWTRRRFVGALAAGGALNHWALPEWVALAAQQPPRSQRGSPEIISGGLVPLMESNVARPLRYTSKQGGFSIQNGDQFFNRSLFPQATRSCHAEVLITYGSGQAQRVELRSPNSWWPVEQDYMVDDYVFRLDASTDAGVAVDWRVDLQTGKARPLQIEQLRGKPGGAIPGGSAFVASIDTDSRRELESIELHTRLYGIVLGWMGLTVERS